MREGGGGGSGREGNGKERRGRGHLSSSISLLVGNIVKASVRCDIVLLCLIVYTSIYT